MGPAAAVLAEGPIETIVHIIQVSLTPVFLLSGVATLLNVFSTRLARVADQVEAVAKQIETADEAAASALTAQLLHLHQRSLALDVAVALGTASGALTCATVLTLFVGETGGLPVAAMLYVTFGLAIACTLASIGAYSAEMLMASRRIRVEVAAAQQMAKPE